MLMLSITSCVSDNDSSTAKPATIRLSLGTGSVTKTRTNTGFPTDNGGTAGTGEGTINTVCVGLFDKDGNTITIYEYTYNGNAVNIQTTTQVTKMVVVANVKSGTFAGATTEDEFMSKEMQLSYTTSTDGQSNTSSTTAGSQTTTALPMTSGEVSPLSLSGDATTDKTVELTRAVARVSVSSIATSFDSNGPYAGATFTPTEIFMYNVNDTYTCGGTASASAIASPVSGESTALSSYAYLGTGTTNYAAPTTTAPQFFYVFPHSSASPTKLVIKGMFTPSGGSAKTVYYPIVINHAQDGTTFTDDKNNTSTTTTNDAEIEANKTYDIKITIKGIGISAPSDDINPSSVTINSQVQDWKQAAVNVNYDDPDIGDYYFSDGSWGTLADHGTADVHPIGVIFSNQTSDIDKKHGWTHGYAMALTNATTNYTATNTCIWSKDENSEDGITYHDDAISQDYTYKDYSSGLYNTFNKDGYSETHAIVKSGKSGYSQDTYPAVYYALNYANSGYYEAPTKTSNSGWYLPSEGQWYDIYANLGGITSSPSYSANGYCYWSDVSSRAINNINSYLRAITAYNNIYGLPDLFSNTNMSYGNNEGLYGGDFYWSSSEYNNDYASRATFAISGHLDLYYDEKNDRYFKVRAVITF